MLFNIKCSDYATFKHLVLVDEFKMCINSDKSFLDERHGENLEVAARLANDYALTHKVSFVNKANLRKPFTHLLVLNQVQVCNLDTTKHKLSGEKRSKSLI